MKKVLLALMLCVVSYEVAFSQADESKKSAFQLSFITPLNTNGLYSSQYTNKVSFNMLVGTSKNEEVFTFGGLSNIIMNDATGFQFAGLSNYIGNDGKGVQFAGLANVNKNSFNGFQFGGLVNTATEMNGFQFAGLTNYVGNEAKGVQFAGLANVNKSSFSGFQFGGLVNTATDIKGLQFAGLTNIAKDVSGCQFAGLVNIAKSVDGVQFAGLINIAENSDCPIGLINIIKNGEKSVTVTYDAIGSTVVSFRSGGKYTYGIIGVGYNHKTKGNSFVTEGGLGAHIPIVSWLRINNEIKFSSIGSNSDKPVFNGGYSLIPAFKIGKHYELFAGASINYMETGNVNNKDIFPNHSLWKKNCSTKLQQLYIGYQVGVQYIF